MFAFHGTVPWPSIFSHDGTFQLPVPALDNGRVLTGHFDRAWHDPAHLSCSKSAAVRCLTAGTQLGLPSKMPFSEKPIARRILGLAPALTLLVAAGCGGKLDAAGSTDRHSAFQSISLPRDESDSSASVPVSSADDASVAIVPPPSVSSSTPPANCPTPEVADTMIPDESSLRFVTFRITNTGTKAVEIAALGRGCTTYSIEEGDGCPVPLLTWASPSCRSDQDWGYADTFSQLPPGDTYETEWDTTEVAAFMQSGCVVGAIRTVKPGVYRATFGFELTLPAECGGSSYCGMRPGTPGGPIYASRCSTSQSVTAEFVVEPPGQVVSDAGDRTVVPISLNADDPQ